MSALRDDFEAWKRTQNDGYDAWDAVLWATERAAKKCAEIKDACDRADEGGDLVMISTPIGAEECAKAIRGAGGGA